jgi:4-hydroxybenzoate polyprenyltransferase
MLPASNRTISGDRLKGWRRRLRRHPWVAQRWPQLRRRLVDYARLMRIDRPIGAFLLLWPTLWALWLAGAGHPDPKVFTVFVAGVFVMRAAGCVVNDFADRYFDPHVKRTVDRPLATRRVSEREAIALFVLLCLIAFGLVLSMNRLTILLSLVGVVLAATYPFMKRYTYLPQPYLGAAFGWSIPMAYAAQVNHVPPVAWLLFIANILWATVYDTMYAMVDRDDDLKIGIKSSAILFGDLDRLIIGVLQVTMLLDMVLIGRQMHLGAAYYIGLGVAACFGLYQQYLIRDRERAPCFKAFLNNNWFGAAIFFGILLHYTFVISS